jgi:hypothetical protein
MNCVAGFDDFHGVMIDPDSVLSYSASVGFLNATEDAFVAPSSE